jgi:hypothetical protein
MFHILFLFDFLNILKFLDAEQNFTHIVVREIDVVDLKIIEFTTFIKNLYEIIVAI